MTHYTTNYEGLSEIEKHNKAIEDIKDYMGAEKFEELTKRVKVEYPNWTLEQFRMAVSFAGVQGYPVKAWYNYIYGL